MSPARPRSADDPTLPTALARGVAFLALATFGALHWMALVEPGAPGRALVGVLVAAGAILALLSVGRRRRARHLLAALVALAALALALMAGGVPATLLRPTHWDQLAAGIARGIEALPGVRVPYRGVDAWIRIVIPVGGTALVAVAALLAFWPRRERLGRPLPALVLLVVLFAVPVVALDLGAVFLDGGIFSLLVLAYLRLETLRVRDARLAAALGAAAVVLAMAAAPLIDEGGPWWDYESWALEASSAKTTTYAWEHSYGPLNWPRDGRELLRIRARRPAYWKAENLAGFDGWHWVEVDAGDTPQTGLPLDPQLRERWTQRIRVSVRNLRTPDFIAAGFATAVQAPGVDARLRGDGTYSAGRPLVRGDAYGATIYSPQPTQRERRAAAATTTDRIGLWPYLRLALPFTKGEGVPPSLQLISFPRFGDGTVPIAAIDGSVGGSPSLARAVLTRGPYARVYRLAQRLQRGAHDQEDYVQNVLRYLGDGFTYTEAPPRSANTLPGFLLRAKTGYCQQFSGAMALLLRMGGVPARVATGFTSGALDRKADEYVVRDLDAHSWVEVWYSGIGWVTFDPTPAVAPPRAQPEEAGTGTASARTPRAPSLPGGDRASSRTSMPAVQESAPSWQLPLLIALGVLGLAAAAWGWRRARRPARAPLTELERALRRMHRDGGPATTLRALESALSASPAAAGYVRAVRDARYGGRPGGPTRSQRRALRTELGRHGGLGARVRAWWALPPL